VKAAHLVKKTASSLKVLGDGEIQVALKLKCDRASASARAKIEAAGGSIETPA
jgi:large subunit ribosomal protein L15